MTIEIRKPKLEEWEQYKKIRLECLKEFPTAFSSSYDEQLDRPDDEWKAFITASEEAKSSIMVCAYDEGKMIGSVAAYWNNRQKVAHVCNLGGMFVKREYQGQGIGKKLVGKLLELLEEMKRFRKIKLDVVEDNISAYNFYLNLGFKKIGVSHDELLIDGKYYNFVTMERFF